ncbi:MAG: NYN domain-containing protein [Marine Group I thaumarchaeote]|nr:MAG: NYN domain-containing protein [Marine Group I thaumarchaeote]
MPTFGSGPSFAGTRRIMVFIDGGYLRKNLIDMFKDDVLNYQFLANKLRLFTSYGNLFPELIRAYYYDAIIQEKESEKYDKQQAYLRKIRDVDYFEVRLGRLKKDGEGYFKQKGVDTLIALDMLSKAYENHYDVAVLLAGDEDFLDVVNSVKNAGKRVFGAFFEKHISSELKDSFDKRLHLVDNFFLNVRK